MLLDIRNNPDVLVITPLESRVDINVAPALLAITNFHRVIAIVE